MGVGYVGGGVGYEVGEWKDLLMGGGLNMMRKGGIMSNGIEEDGKK